MAFKVKVVESRIYEKPKDDKIYESCSESKTTKKCANVYDDVPVYTDKDGNIHVNKEWAKEFPDIVQNLINAEVEKLKLIQKIS